MNDVFTINHETDKNFILNLFKISRKKFKDPISFFDSLINKIENDSAYRAYFLKEMRNVFGNIVFVSYLTDSGLMQDDSFFSVFKKKLNGILLPQIEDDDTLVSIINEVFYNKKNFEAFKIIPKDRWEKFYEALFLDGEEKIFNKKKVSEQVLESLTILIDRICGGFSDGELVNYRPELIYTETPFAKLSIEIRNIINRPEQAYDTLMIKQCINQCKTYLGDILMQKDKKGISLKITVKINRILEKLSRLQVLLNSLNDLRAESKTQFLTNASNSWVEFYSPKKWISNQISSTLYLVTFLATYHNGRTGEKYITSSSKEYWKMFYTAVGGGAVVAVLCYIKLYLGSIHDSSPFFKAFFYSLNYAAGFVFIYLTHMTLATKQPSMTAARISESLLPEKGETDYKSFSSLYAKLSRSQFIAFMGNVFACFGLSMLFFFLFKNFTNAAFISRKHVEPFWVELSEMHSQIFWFASIAGFFLFLSGLISGLVINSQRYNRVPKRIYEHPTLKRFFSERSRLRISTWFKKNNGGIIGNLTFGFMMGSAFLVGKFLGISFDIRHITFAAGNLAMGIYGIEFQGVTPWLLFLGFTSVFLIGAFNFLVSFALSLILAMKSNNIPLSKIFPMIKSVIKEFFRSPTKFFFPVEKNKIKEEIESEIEIENK